MGTKSNPGSYDCYAKADPDEPLFTLRGKDPSAPYLVAIWRAVRLGFRRQALVLLMQMFDDPAVKARVSTEEYDKLQESLLCAAIMKAWRIMLDEEQAKEQVREPGSTEKEEASLTE